MKITDIETIVVAVPAARPHPMAFGPSTLGEYVIVKVNTDEEVHGLGEATVLPRWGGDHGKYYGESVGTVVTVVRDLLAPALDGADPLAIEAAHMTMNGAIKGHPYAKAAIDIALHDIAGKALGVPVYQLLGGAVRYEVPIAHSLGILDVELMVNAAARVVEEGVRTVKCKIGLDPRRDVAVVEAVRDVVGDDVRIVVDANQGYDDPKTAIKVIRQIEQFDIEYVEQPVEGMRQMARVAKAVDVPVMADETAWNATDILEIVAHGAADRISVYTTKPGGLAPAKKVAAVAEAAGLRCNVNGSAELGVGNAANLHLAAATPSMVDAAVIPVTTLKGREQTDVAGVFYGDDIIKEAFDYRDGRLRVPTAPGLGVELDPEKVAAYRIDV